MSNSIRPPGPSSSPAELSELDAVEPAASEGAEPQVDEAQAASEAAPVASETLDALGQLAAALESGQLDVASAVEQLLERAMDPRLVGPLDGAQRQALEQHLRQALVDDPSLSAMLGDLRRL